VIRYLRLFLYFVRFSVSRSMEFRMDFFFRIVMDSFYYVVNIGFFLVLFRHTKLLGGWTEAQMLVFLSGALMVDGLAMTFLSNNLWQFPQLVNRGDLDYYLVRPVSTLFFISLRDFAFNSFINLMTSIGIVFWAISRLERPPGAAEVALYLVLICVGAFLHYVVHMLSILPVFWTHSARGFEQVFFSMTKVSERPDRVFTGAVRVVFLYLLPMLMMTSYPARLLLDGFDWLTLGEMLAVVAGATAVLLAIWRHGLRSYSSASS
jgi:ABC-2 type transport system permease protein